LINREFIADKPNEKWLTDITEHPTNEGKIYWCGIKDLFSNKIVGVRYSMNRMTIDLAKNALLDALEKENWPKNVIIHSDRGSQFNANEFRKLINEFELKPSMGQVHTCADNSPMESMNSLIQKNVFNQQKIWKSRNELIVKLNRLNKCKV